MRAPRSTNRKQEILETLVEMLQEQPCSRVTTAVLAKRVGVSEAALYRHFPSKTRMYLDLFEYVDETLFSQVSRFSAAGLLPQATCRKVVEFFLAFMEKNPGLCRLLTSDSLSAEDERLARQMTQFYERLQTELRQIFRKGEIEAGIRTRLPVGISSDLLMSVIEGRLVRFVRSDFRQLPTADLEHFWSLLEGALYSTE